VALADIADIADWVLSKLFRHVDVNHDGRLRVRRWFVLRSSRGGLYVHRIVQSDSDPHNHPWSFVTFVLSGGYIDTSYRWGPCWNRHDSHRHFVVARQAKPLRAYRRTASDIHEIKLHKDHAGNEREAWTLAFVGCRQQERHFVTPGGPVHWRTHLDEWGPDPD